MDCEPTVYKEPDRVTIERAANGYTITTHTDTGRAVEVAKTMTEVNRITKRILKG